MKKFLSLVLALVMTASLVTVSAGAKEFKDDKDVTYDEAVAVISEIGVVDGDTDGNFRPTDNLSRGAAAKIICNLILGPTTAAELKADTAPFKDVAVSNTFSGYIAYCAKEGIISGYADGSFRPAGTLTGYAFMKMLLGALGYDGTYEGYTGANWSIAVAKQAIGIGLNKGLTKEFNGVDFVTREEAALYAFNTLKATLVSYDQKITTNVNGVDVTITQGAAKPVTWSEGKNNDGNIKPDTFVQFAEEYFPKLVGKKSSDDFERPATQWVFDKKDIGTFVRWEQLVEKYTAGVTGKEVYDLLTGAVIDDNDVYRYVDGGLVENFDEDKVLVRSNKSDLDYTGNGVLTEIYLDTDTKELTIVSINTWLAKATADYSESTESATVKIFNGVTKQKTDEKTEIVDVELVPAVAELKKDQYILVNRSEKDNDGVLQIVAISDVEILEDCTVTGFSKNGEDDEDLNGPSAKGLYKSVTTGGEKYDGAAKAFYDAAVLNEYNADLLKDSKYNVYLDPYGYAIGVDLFEGTKNYVFITGYNRTANSNISIDTSDAAAIFIDGTMKTIKVNVNDTNKNIDAVNEEPAYAPYFDEDMDAQGHDLWRSGGEPNENKWYTYTEKDGVYTLKPVKQQSATTVADIPGMTGAVGKRTGTIDCSKVYLPDSYRSTGGRYFAYGDDESVYLVVSQDKVDTTGSNKVAITSVDGVYTGVQDVKIEVNEANITSTVTNFVDKEYHVDPVYTLYDGDNYVIASIVLGEAQGASKNYAYILSGAKSESVEDGVAKWTFDAVLNGKKQTLTTTDKFSNTIQNLRPFTVQELMFDNETVVKVKDVDAADQLTCSLEEIKRGDHDVFDVTFTNNNGAQGLGTLSGNDLVSGSYLAKVNETETNVSVANANSTTLDVWSRTLTFTKMAGTPHSGVDKSEPVGLTFVKDAPAVVVRSVNNEVLTDNCASVEEALGLLGDAYSSVPGQQFRGRIVAALNDVGVAEWIVFISSTQLGTKDPTTPDKPIEGGMMGARSTLAAVNAALETGNVIINGTWLPIDAKSGYNLLSLSGHDLWIKGDFNAHHNGTTPAAPGTADTNIVIDHTTGNETLRVDGKFTESEDVRCNVIAESAELYLKNAETTVGNMTVSGNLKVTGSNKLIIPAGVTVSVGSLSGGTDANTIEVYGTLIVNGKVQGNATTGNLTINVHSTNSLHVTGEITNTIVNVGAAAPSITTGKVEIGTVGTGSTLTVVNGTAEVGTVVSSATKVSVKADGVLTITGDLAVAPSDNKQGATIKFGSSATVSGTAGKMFTDGTVEVSNVGGLTFEVKNNGEDDPFVNENAKVEYLTGTIDFYWDQSSWLEAGVPVEWLSWNNKTGSAVWDEETFKAELLKRPGVFVTVDVANGLEVDSVKVAKIEVNGKEVEVNYKDGNTIGIENNKGIMGIELVNRENGEKSHDYLKLEKIEAGARVDITLELTVGENQTVTEVLYGTYDGPTAPPAESDKPTA